MQSTIREKGEGSDIQLHESILIYTINRRNSIHGRIHGFFPRFFHSLLFFFFFLFFWLILVLHLGRFVICRSREDYYVYKKNGEKERKRERRYLGFSARRAIKRRGYVVGSTRRCSRALISV